MALPFTVCQVLTSVYANELNSPDRLGRDEEPENEPDAEPDSGPP